MTSEPVVAPVMESVDCVLCGPGAVKEMARIRDLKFFCPGEFSLVRCPRCRLTYLNPRPTPDAMADHYPETYWNAPEEGVPGVYLDSAARGVVDTLCRRYPGGRVLDVGCGSGGLVAHFRDRGMDAMGVEPMACPAELARDRYGLNVVKGYLADAAFPDDSFDAVTLFDVLEHTHDPVAELAEVRRVLKPGGAVFVKVPNIASLQARLLGKWWFGLDTPRHLYHFSPGTLRRVLSRAGFSQVSARAVTGVSGALLFEWSVLFWLRGMLLARRGVSVAPSAVRPPSESLDGQVYASVPRGGKQVFRWFVRRALYAPVAIENVIGRSVGLVGIATK